MKYQKYQEIGLRQKRGNSDWLWFSAERLKRLKSVPKRVLGVYISAWRLNGHFTTVCVCVIAGTKWPCNVMTLLKSA